MDHIPSQAILNRVQNRLKPKMGQTTLKVVIGCFIWKIDTSSLGPRVEMS